MRREVAIGIVVYNAGENLLDRLKMAVSAGYSVYVFDNSPSYDSVKKLAKSLEGINYFTCGNNVGLGYGISTVCAQAEVDNFQALIFFDQDTGFSEDTLNFVEKFYLDRKQLVSKYSAFLFNSKNHSDASLNSDGLRDVNLAINSGSLYFLENLKKQGWHDASYFVDGVDYKFCLESAKHKMKIGECSYTPGFDHVTEQEDSLYSLFGKDYQLRPYSWRRIVDTSVSSVRLITYSLLNGEWKFLKILVRLFAIYLATQVYVRVVNFWSRNKNV
ncbi:glycosyltransferase [Pseudomonas serbica]|jgi:rhamnosyltransferase|uniref:glycosyltransferase n=1 Tax=Pseudomonas serbica TaxID=2965074 RepID=UPI00237B0C6A|nr:glycosyltransferase [Pseudomonas serbica]